MTNALEIRRICRLIFISAYAKDVYICGTAETAVTARGTPALQIHATKTQRVGYYRD